MKRSRLAKLAASIVLCVSLAALVGCGPIALLMGAFSAGSLFGWSLPEGGPSVSVVIQRTCYQNGVEVDCASLGIDGEP